MFDLQPSGGDRDDELSLVCDWWQQQRDAASRIGDVLRRAFDEVLDGQRTGRYLYEDMANTEKTYVGTKVEILLREEFGLPRGPEPKRLDFGIAEVGVDCKYTQSTSWMIPVEAVGELCVLVTASDATARFSFGVLRCDLALLNAPNRDQKRSISKAGRDAATWLWRDEPMPENLLRNISDADRHAIFADQGSGQRRINELFRRVHGRIVRREVTLTVAQQRDAMKRPRDARQHLQPEGILILGHQGEHPRIARDLGQPVPKKGEFVACRVIPTTVDETNQGRLNLGQPNTVINAETWQLAEPTDPVIAGPSKY